MSRRSCAQDAVRRKAIRELRRLALAERKAGNFENAKILERAADDEEWETQQGEER